MDCWVGFSPGNPDADVFFFPHGSVGAIPAKSTQRVELYIVC